jgi:hypothetical protein
MTKRRRNRALVLSGVLLGLTALAVPPARVLLTRRSDVADQRALYNKFSPYPGAARISERSYEHVDDNEPLGRYGLTTVYELPAEAKAAAVLDFYRSHIPTGWTAVSDRTCDASMVRAAPITVPTMTFPAGTPSIPTSLPDYTNIGLMFRESELTVFAPGHDWSNPTSVVGFTFRLSREGARKLLTLDEPLYSCGRPEPDTQAAAFDAP